MGRTIKLMDYLPLFLQDFSELRAIMTAVNPKSQAVYNEGQVVLDNTFILYADTNGLSLFEKMMGIYPSVNDTLDARRSRVLARWNDTVPYTLNSFLQKLKTLQGNGNVQVMIDGYTLYVVTQLEKQGQQDDLAYLFKTILPCNLGVVSTNVLNCAVQSQYQFGSGITCTEVIGISTLL